MAASSNMKRNYYHVFLSFRGPDVRHGFLSHLYAALDQRGIHTFVDREELRKGEQISPALMRAIEESRIAIIVFSEDYASSPWCLDELLKIMECKEQNDLMVVYPVFYKVEPREVRGGRESYKRAMDNHESKFGKDSEKVKRWKRALLDAGNLSGWDFNDRDDEAELIKSIAEELSDRLRPRSLYVAKYPVGIESQVQKLISLSQPAGSDVLMIGLWGPGGMGKTTIAKALYNAIENQFQGCSFLDRVRERSNQSGGLVALQEQLLSQIFSRPKFMVYTVDEGISLIQERLCRKKVLLVLDDVDDMDQLNALAGKGDWFGQGSRIIITSRDRHLLTSHDKNYVYEVKILEDNEARDLFGQHAFTNSNKVEIRRDLIDGALHYAGGLPLALEVLGSFLRGRKEPEWESTLHKLSKIPESKINRVLKISFDGLDKNEREIFLDIACFFKGKSIKDIKEVLDSCDFNTTIGIEILIERSLIEKRGPYLQMHDLVQLMGRNIVNRECLDDPRKRSRFWLFEDFQDILCENMEMNAVKAIVLDLPTPEEITISHDTFSHMKMLRILILLEVDISSQVPVRLPHDLRYLKWPNAPDLEFGSGLKKLVRLDVQKGHIRSLGANFLNQRKLKFINFSECKSLASIPDLSPLPYLESLNFDGCKSLVEVHQSIGCRENLKLLSLEGCSKLSIFPKTLKTGSLQILGLSGCSKLENFPDILGKMRHLECLKLQGMTIEELPASIKNLVFMNEMELAFCEKLERLPSSIYELKNLKTLKIENCSNLVMFPKNKTDLDVDLVFLSLESLVLSGCNLSEVEFLESYSSFPRLTFLDLSNNKFTHLPIRINKYNNLMYLLVNKCEQLQEIPELPPNLCSLKANNCKSLLKTLKIENCSNLVMFLKNTTDLDVDLVFLSLESLVLSGCNLSEVGFLESYSSFPRLAFLDLSNNKFTHLPICINKYNNLMHLLVNKCEQLQEIPELPPNLYSLKANNCKSLQKLPDLSGHSSKELYVELFLCSELHRKGVNLAYEELPKMKEIEIVQSGREMPKWILDCKMGSISCMIPQDSYDKFFGVALCVVLDLEDRKMDAPSCEVQLFINSRGVFSCEEILDTSESDIMWLRYVPCRELININELRENDWCHIQVHANASEGHIKRYGFRIICEQRKDDLRVMFPVPSADRNKVELFREDS